LIKTAFRIDWLRGAHAAMVVTRSSSRSGLDSSMPSLDVRRRNTAGTASGAPGRSADSTSSDDEDALSRETSHLNLSALVFSLIALQRRLSGMAKSSRLSRVIPGSSLKVLEGGAETAARRPGQSAASCGTVAYPVVLVCTKSIIPDQVNRGTVAYPVVLVCTKSIIPDRANRHITTHYRPDGSASVLAAFFQFHNQTINIWSHMLGLPYVFSYLSMWSASGPAEDSYVLALQLHTCIGMLVGAASVAYHAGEVKTSHIKNVSDAKLT